MESFKNPFGGEIVVAPPPKRRRYRRFRKESRKAILIACGILVLLVPIAYVTARPVYTAFKQWRAERLVTEAEALIAQEKWEDALHKAHAASLLDPGNARNLRLVAEVFAHFGSERALDYWQLAVTVNPKGKEERRQLIETAILYKQLPLAAANAAELLAQAPDDAGNLMLAAKVARTMKDHLRELELLQRARALQPSDPELEFFLHRVLTQVGAVDQAAESMAVLREMATRQDSSGIEALDFFVVRPVSDFPDRLRLAQLLREHPNAAPIHHIKACAIAIDAEPAARAAHLDRLSAFAAGGDVQTLAPVAEWLLRIGEPTRVLQILPWTMAQQSEHLALLHADALSRMRDVAQLEEVLSTPGLVLRKEFAHLCRWQASLEPDGRGGNDREARTAIEAAEARPNSLGYIAARFEEIGRLDFAEQAYVKLRSAPKFDTVATMGLVRIARRNQDTKTLLKLMEKARQDGAADPTHEAEVLHLALLLRQNAPDSRERAARLAAEHPARMVIQSAHALACLRDGDPAAALNVFKKARFDWTKAAPANRAVYAAALIESGRAGEAAEVVASLRPHQLLPEERELLIAKTAK